MQKSETSTNISQQTYCQKFSGKFESNRYFGKTDHTAFQKAAWWGSLIMPLFAAIKSFFQALCGPVVSGGFTTTVATGSF